MIWRAEFEMLADAGVAIGPASPRSNSIELNQSLMPRFPLTCAP